MRHDSGELEYIKPPKLLGKIYYGYNKGPFLRKPNWKSYTDFRLLRILLIRNFPNLNIPLLPKKAPWYTKTKWHIKRIEFRRIKLHDFLTFCMDDHRIYHSNAWKHFANPFNLNTIHYDEMDYMYDSIIEKSANIDVHKVTIDDKSYAVKSFDIRKYNPYVLANEINIHLDLNHSSCLRAHGYRIVDKKYELILDLADYSLADTLDDSNGIQENIARFWFYQLMLGVYYLHINSIAHRDIKPENLLIMSDGSLKICDFGFALKKGACSLAHAKCGSINFVAPEVLEKDEYDPMISDIFSCGVTLFVMLAGTRPFEKETITTFSPQVQDLLKKMLTKEPEKRIPIKNIFTHPWMVSVYNRGDISVIQSSIKIPFRENDRGDVIYEVYGRERNEPVSIQKYHYK